MTKITLILIVGLLISSCKSRTTNNFESIPISMQPNWTGIEVEKIPVKFGQVLKFKIDSTELTSIVLDFDEDEGGKWIGLCFIKDDKLFGRQIPNGMIHTTCLDLLDLSYLKIDSLRNFQIVDSLNIDKNKIGIGSISPALNLAGLERDFKRGFEQRKKEQTLCDNGLTDLNSVRECYFEIKKIIN